MKKPLWLVLWALVLEVLVILVLIPGDWTDKAIEKERGLVAKSLGSKSQAWMQGKADKWYQSTIIDSGLYANTHFLLIPTKKEKERSRGMERMGRLWFEWVESRIDALASAIYQFFTRAALLLIWAPYILILLFPSIYDGVTTRRIKTTNFDYPSPILHRYSLRLIFYIGMGLMIAFFAPIAIDPIIIPIALMSVSALIGVNVGNFQKRM